MAGVILLTAMAAGGISLWIKRRRESDGLGQDGLPDTEPPPSNG